MKKFFKETKVGRFIAGLFRGIVKSNPFGNALIEGIENVKAEKGKEPHNWTSIVIQLIGIAVILYAFFTKQITVDDVLHYLSNISSSDVPTVIHQANDSLQAIPH